MPVKKIKTLQKKTISPLSYDAEDIEEANRISDALERQHAALP